ncbi:MAG: GNAT family N-acetyltransferase [Bacteroidota bacterium]
MIIRQATVEDLERVMSFPQTREELFYIYPSAQFPLTVEQLKSSFEAREGNTAVELNGEVVAFANYISVKEKELAVIGNVIVAPMYRGQGVGKNLINYMFSNVYERYGCLAVDIPCFNTNTRGLVFYHRLGFIPYRAEEKTDFNGQPVLLLYLKRKIEA